MMGHVMDLFLRFIEEQGGAESVDRVFAVSGLERREYRFEQVYPEDEFGALVGAALEVLETDVSTVEAAFASFFMRVSPEIFPAIFELSENAQTLLSRIPHVHRSIPSAASKERFVDKLVVSDQAPGRLLLRYESPHKLCGFLKRVAQLTLDYYGETGEIIEHDCARQGAEACSIEIRFDAA